MGRGRADVDMKEQEGSGLGFWVVVELGFMIGSMAWHAFSGVLGSRRRTNTLKTYSKSLDTLCL